MSYLTVQPESDKPSVFYRQKLSWKITEEDWNKSVIMSLQLKTEIPIPGAYHGNIAGGGWASPYPGGFILLNKDVIAFITHWSKDVELEKIHIDAKFRLKTKYGATTVDIRDHGHKRIDKNPDHEFFTVGFLVIAKLNPELLFSEERSFTLEADLLVEKSDTNKDNFKQPNSYVKDMMSTFHDVKNSDVLVLAGDEEFKCHKNILSARCEVFKNTLAHGTLESTTNTIVVKDVPAKAVETMLKYIYTGELPDDPKNLNIDLLHIAEMYQIEGLKEACVKHLLESLDVSSCISIFILVDLYLPHGGQLREMVVKFMECKAKQVVDMEDWAQLMDSHPALALELVKAMVKGKEKHKCQFCLVSYKIE